MIYKLQKGDALPSLLSILRLKKRGEPLEDAWKAEKQRVDREIKKIKLSNSWMGKTADVFHHIGVGGTGLGLLGSFVAAPAATALGLIGGVAGEQVVNKVTKKVSNFLTNGKGKTWNEYAELLGLGPTLAAITNPGGWLGGTAGAKASLIRLPQGIVGMNLPFKHKFRSPSGRIWSKEDISSFIKSQRGKDLTNAELEEFIRSNGLESIKMPNGNPGFLEKTEGSILRGISDIINPPTSIPGAEGKIHTLKNLGLTQALSGRLGYTLDTRNGLPRYQTIDLFTPNGLLRGGQEAFFRMRPSKSGHHGEANWKPKNHEEEASSILRTHFNGNPGETAIDAYTGKQLLNPDGTGRVMSPLRAIMSENPTQVSGTYTNAEGGEYSLDSYLILLAKLRDAYNKGMNLRRTRYNTLNPEKGEVQYEEMINPNKFSTKVMYNTSGISPEYLSLLRQHYKGSTGTTEARGLPQGTKVQREGDLLHILYNGKSLGYIRKQDPLVIMKTLIDAIEETNNVLQLKGKDRLAAPVWDKLLLLPNPQFIIYKNGGKI